MRDEARARLRPFAVADRAVSEADGSVSATELDKLATRLSKGDDWRDVFRGLASLEVEQPADTTYGFKIMKRGDAVPARIVGKGDPDADEAVVIRERDWFERYPFSMGELAKKAGIRSWDAQAIVFFLDLRSDPASYSERRAGKVEIKRFSQAALAAVRALVDRGQLSEAQDAYKEELATRKASRAGKR